MKSKEKIKLGRTNSEASIAVCVISNRIIWITFKKKHFFSLFPSISSISAFSPQ
jgi:hypothetical protein